MSQINVPKAKTMTLDVGDPLAEIIGGSDQSPFGLHPVDKSPGFYNGGNEGLQIESPPKAQPRRKGPP